LTASVAAPAPADNGPTPLDSLDGFFRSEPGRAALARDGRAASVQVLDTRLAEDVFYIRLRDTGAAAMPGMAADYWRGLFDLNGHLVTVAATAFADRPLTAEEGFAKIAAFVARIRAETPRRDPERASEGVQGFFAQLLR